MNKKIKKIIKISALCLTITSILGQQAFAFGGYAHWDIAGRTASAKGYTSNNKWYYQSGALLADIGKSSWDSKYGVLSDMPTFCNAMDNQLVVSDSSYNSYYYYVAGWKDHRNADRDGSVMGISGGPSSYRVRCGWIDEYLRDFKGISTPINGASLAVCYSLISKTYAKTTGFSPTISQIDSEIKDMYNLYNVQIGLNVQGWSTSEKNSIETELNRVATSVAVGTSGVYADVKSLDIQDSQDNYELICKLIREDKTGELNNLLSDVSSNMTLNKKLTDVKDIYSVTISINDNKKYEKDLKKLQDKLSKEIQKELDNLQN